MKVKFCCDNNANIHSKREELFDTEKDLCYGPGEWEELSEDQKCEVVKEWAMERFEYWFEEQE